MSSYFYSIWFRNNNQPCYNISSIQGGMWPGTASLEISNSDTWGLPKKKNKLNNGNGISITEIMQNHSHETIDILIKEIEDYEAFVFDSEYEYWLTKVKVMIYKHSNKKIFIALSKKYFSCRIINGMLVFEQY